MTLQKRERHSKLINSVYHEDLWEIIDEVNGQGEDIDVLESDIADIQTGAFPIPLAGISGALGEYAETDGNALYRSDTQSLDVRKLGAKGDSTTDDTAAIQAAIDEGYPRIVVPPPVSATDYYKVTEPLIPLDNQEICGAAGFQVSTTGQRQIRLYNPAGDGPMFNVDGKHGVTFRNLVLFGNGISSKDPDEMGIVGDAATQITIDKCYLYRFGGPGIKVLQSAGNSIGWFIRDSQLLGCCYGYENITGITGALDLDGTDHYIQNNELKTPGQVSGYLSGYTVALYVRNSANWITFNTFELSERGAVFAATAKGNMVMGNSSELNYGEGYNVAGYENIFIGNRAERNGLAADNTYDGYAVTGYRNQFVGNSASSLASGEYKQRYAFRDTSSNSEANHNLYLGNRGSNMGTGVYSVSDADNVVLDFTTRTANADTSGATLGQLETEVNEIKALLRTQGLMKA